MNDRRNDLSADANEIVRNRSPLWEYQLFAQLLEEELRGIEPPVSGGFDRQLGGLDELVSWVQEEISRLKALVLQTEATLAAGHDGAFGSPGVDGDVDAICELASSLAEITSTGAEWEDRVLATRVDPPYREVQRRLLEFGGGLRESIRRFPADVRGAVESANREQPGPGTSIALALCVELPNVQHVVAALEAAASAGIHDQTPGAEDLFDESHGTTEQVESSVDLDQLGPNTYVEICVDCGEPFKNVHQVDRLSNKNCYWCQRGQQKPANRVAEDRDLWAQQLAREPPAGAGCMVVIAAVLTCLSLLSVYA